jgi:hypothetical protein
MSVLACRPVLVIAMPLFATDLTGVCASVDHYWEHDPLMMKRTTPVRNESEYTQVVFLMYKYAKG